MKCETCKNNLALYLEDALEPDEMQAVKSHLAQCAACQKETAALSKSWELLDQWDAIEPEPNYVSRFWTRVATETSWSTKVWQILGEVVTVRRLVPVLATVCVLLIVGTVVWQNYLAPQPLDSLVARLSDDEWEMLENLELAENFDLIEDLDFWEDFEIIENLDALESKTSQQPS